MDHQSILALFSPSYTSHLAGKQAWKGEEWWATSRGEGIENRGPPTFRGFSYTVRNESVKMGLFQILCDRSNSPKIPNEGCSIRPANAPMHLDSRSTIRELLRKQKYQLYGKSVAVKKCMWTHKALRGEDLCYKAIYGIKSHQCIQMTPVPPELCSHQCLYCWRVEPQDLGMAPPDLAALPPDLFDPPETVFEGMLWCWKRIISGYKSYVDLNRYSEAEQPQHVAISLAGEPTIYPTLIEFLQLIHEHGMTSFLVTNGTYPETLQRFIDEKTFPTQLYITLPAPDETTYRKTCRPLISDGWQRIQKSLDLANSMNCRTVARLTLAKGLNMKNAHGFANLIEQMNPSFIEVKGVVHVGFAQRRIKKSAMPFFEEILQFTEDINQYLDAYKQIGEKKASLISILSNSTHPSRIPGL